MSSSRSRVVVRAVVAAVALLAIALFIRLRTGDEDARAAPKPGKEARATAVSVATVERRDVPIWLEGLGTVAAWQQVTVHPQVDGRLDRVFFKEGQSVKRGEELALIDPRPFDAQLHQAEGTLERDRALLENARLNLKRYQSLLDGKLIAPQQATDQEAVAAQAEGTVRSDEAQVETARLNVGYAHVTSPLDGVVGVRLVDPGNLVRATDPNGLVVITQLDPAALYVTLPEDVLPEVVAAMKRGDVPVEAYSRDGATKLGAGKLFVIDNQINQATATLRLKCRLPNPDRLLWPNQFVKARLLVDLRKSAIVTETAAVQHGPKGAFVYVVGAGNLAEMRPVEIALTEGDLTIIGKGLAAGDRVVVEGQTQLRPGAPLLLHTEGAR